MRQQNVEAQLRGRKKKHRRNRKHSKPCPTGKVRYRDHGEAVRQLHGVKATGQSGYVPIRAYFCERCKGYHLSSKPA